MSRKSTCPRSQTIEEKLSIAWEMKGCTTEELRQRLKCSRDTATDYRRMVDLGVREVAYINPGDWKKITERFESGEHMRNIAASYGRTASSMRYWLLTNDQAPKSTPEVPGRPSPQSVPFSRFGELFGPEVAA